MHQKRRLLKLPIIAAHVLLGSHPMIAIVTSTGCHVVTLSSRFRGELQAFHAATNPLLDLTTRKVQYWQVHFLNVNILELNKNLYLITRTQAVWPDQLDEE